MLKGEIPESIASMKHLDVLDLSNNELTGEIPESLVHVMQLEVLNMSNNKLTGKVPEFLRKMKALDLSNNKMTYSIPKGKSHSTYLIKILGAIGAVAVFIACCLLLGFLWTRNLHREGFNQTVRKMLQKVKALVFEFFSNGSLEKLLYQDNAHSCKLGLKEVLNIAIDIAHAVKYIHYDCHVQIVHCDIKPSIVLLDESVTAHLSDFGISRFMGGISANSVNSTMDLKGSVGYIAPEYGLKFEWHDINSRRCLQLWHFIIGNVDKEEAN
ncbi:putative leucine-rich repeat receptor-like serine/threonine-protein kinase At2g24130 [Cryptomeria japonica]|uniref:putative leucine-rich repeat receptor-like serine/threonine-protein kinase At2g24130 n=1 Tax=Cryptomeria japonica TaxID=3369 RepID=UPI0027DA17F7|nr:putative leucine-rich repeat receptor-like serine/threonine-protein kinase At2g24130 [Cryptomeria japonica]